MFKNKKIISIIPARGGSKRLPRKNVRLLAGKPLIAHSIEAVKKSRYISRVIVSTEDKEIAGISKKWGAEVIKRPGYLATDKAKTIDVVFHLLLALKKERYYPDIIVLLQPTSPLRSGNDIDKAIEIFLKSKCKSLVSVSERESNFWWSFKINKNYLEPFFGWGKFFGKSQDLPKIYAPNGSIYISTTKNLFKYKSFYQKSGILPYIMPREKSIDIDYEIEFLLTELLMKKRK